MELTLINFNISNKVVYKNYDGGSYPQKFACYVNKENPDIICLQELTDNYQKALQALLPHYHFTGQNRFHQNSLWYSHFGETNAIITNQKVYKSRTYSLSKDLDSIGKRSFLSIFPRIATVTTIQKDNEFLTVINTHLDHLSHICRSKQIKYLMMIINENQNNPIILTGDFNLNTDNLLFTEFVKFMEEKKCRLVNVEENTFKPPVNPFKIAYNFKTPDHIFIPKEFTVENVSVVDNELSDHKLVKIKIRS